MIQGVDIAAKTDPYTLPDQPSEPLREPTGEHEKWLIDYKGGRKSMHNKKFITAADNAIKRAELARPDEAAEWTKLDADTRKSKLNRFLATIIDKYGKQTDPERAKKAAAHNVSNRRGQRQYRIADEMQDEVARLLEKITFESEDKAKQFESGVVQLIQGEWAPEVASDEGEVELSMWNDRMSTYISASPVKSGWELRARIWQAPKMRKLYLALLKIIVQKRASANTNKVFPGFFANALSAAPSQAGEAGQLPWRECISTAWLQSQNVYQETDFPPAPPAVLDALNLELPDSLFTEADNEWLRECEELSTSGSGGNGERSHSQTPGGSGSSTGA
ncbi:unnamed protein product [Peniophora sp. CBMAI 1063]|nr:unnamed protein product [Peniophora sp. CBMAI 1063]